jgi:hypothetical protein
MEFFGGCSVEFTLELLGIEPNQATAQSWNKDREMSAEWSELSKAWKKHKDLE